LLLIHSTLIVFSCLHRLLRRPARTGLYYLSSVCSQSCEHFPGWHHEQPTSGSTRSRPARHSHHRWPFHGSHPTCPCKGQCPWPPLPTPTSAIFTICGCLLHQPFLADQEIFACRAIRPSSGSHDLSMQKSTSIGTVSQSPPQRVFASEVASRTLPRSQRARHLITINHSLLQHLSSNPTVLGGLFSSRRVHRYHIRYNSTCAAMDDIYFLFSPWPGFSLVLIHPLSLQRLDPYSRTNDHNLNLHLIRNSCQPLRS
jgi:hypothetical protein